MQAMVQVTGIVQGVGFRPFVYRLAVKHGLVGYVFNRGDAGVEIAVEGPSGIIKRFLDDLENQIPPLAAIDTKNVSWREDSGFQTFTIRVSSEKRGSIPSIVPPDVSICEKCIEEMTCSDNRRHQYFFTTCTDCGPRYTIITDLPYDRPATTMDSFTMCDACHAEYVNPIDRRYHAQTIACTTCGPQVHLHNHYGEIMKSGATALSDTGHLLENGAVIAVKGNGGYHLACSAYNNTAIIRLRRLLLRPHQPFAIMVGNIDMAHELAMVNKQETQLLTSPAKPIVVMKKKGALNDVAPGLHTLGVMLPYTGLHVLLFQNCSHPLVMTSANIPGEPIIYQNEMIFRAYENKIDFFVTYDRSIAHRCDDSVIRVVAGRPMFLRRSRGYTPTPIPFPEYDKKIVAVGAEQNATACVTIDNKAYLSPYIGNTSKPNTLQFLEREIRHLLTLTNIVPEIVAHDLHPAFASTGFALQLAEEYGAAIQPVQHHHAHLAKVLGEHSLKEAVGIAIDGMGYGDDNTVWGGEIMYCTPTNYTRIGHLEPHPLVGGDLASRYPLRMVAGILSNEADIQRFLYLHSNTLPHGKEEADIILQQAQKGIGTPTSSCGRVLDAAAALLAICFERTYEGEPAMLLESHARSGTAESLPVSIAEKNPTMIMTTPLFKYLWAHKDENTQDLAATTEHYVAQGLAQVAIDYAQKNHVDVIALAGGCAYNEHITTIIENAVAGAGLQIIRNQKLPAGDGGICYGQAMVAGARQKK